MADSVEMQSKFCKVMEIKVWEICETMLPMNCKWKLTYRVSFMLFKGATRVSINM